ncbi:MAG: NUDIX domain-containing protein [Rubrivivax sp.]|nr:NUDIX domain-containing protein [Rubrivivax sp.]
MLGIHSKCGEGSITLTACRFDSARCGEPWQAAAVRELREEAGIIVNPTEPRLSMR